VEKLRGEPTSGHLPRSGTGIKDGSSGTEVAQMRDNPEGGELDPAVDGRCCKKNSPSVYLIQVRR